MRPAAALWRLWALDKGFRASAQRECQRTRRIVSMVKYIATAIVATASTGSITKTSKVAVPMTQTMRGPSRVCRSLQDLSSILVIVNRRLEKRMIPGEMSGEILLFLPWRLPVRIPNRCRAAPPNQMLNNKWIHVVYFNPCSENRH
jgi:hypothetical protein